MRRRFILRLALFILPFLSRPAMGQPDHFAYAVTSVSKGGNAWVALRKLDIRTGEFSNILLNVENNEWASQSVRDSSIAALAYDRRTNRLYYSPMNIDQLRYIDLSSMQSFAVPEQYFSKAGNYDVRNAGPVNRMVIAPDGYGYTITNDGTHLIRFSTLGEPLLKDLGDLQDDPLNREMTIHSICANSGGDLIADDAGNLFLITGTNKIFKVNISSRIASYQGTVSGLPQKFTTSGAAVSENGKEILLASVTYPDAYFSVDPKNWTASEVKTRHDVFETADLANSNILFTRSSSGTDLFPGKSADYSNRIRVFPNPVMDDHLSVQFNNLFPGLYTIQLADLLGNKVFEQKAVINNLSQTELLHLPGTIFQGFYTVRILDDRNNVVSTQKLIVERW